MKIVTDLHAKVGEDVAALGGVLRCETCARVVEFWPGAQGYYLQRGWPRCCGYTMRLWTQRQIDAGEMPK